MSHGAPIQVCGIAAQVYLNRFRSAAGKLGLWDFQWKRKPGLSPLAIKCALQTGIFRVECTLPPKTENCVSGSRGSGR
jgi:hypothetical protein